MPDDYYVSQYSGEEIDALLGSAGASNFVRYDAAQSLTESQKTQARGNIGSAPSGYGLGENQTTGPMMSTVTADTLDTTYNNGWYFAYGVNIAGFTQAVVRVDSSGRTIFQTAFVAISDHILRRCLADTIGTAPNNSFGPWEWVNPPMQLGVEYRTTERYLGKPIYCKVVDCGNLPNAGRKAVSIGVSGLEKVIDVSGCAIDASNNDFYSIPVTDFNSSVHNVGLYATGSQTIVMTTQSDRSMYNAYVKVRYTKTTD